MSAPIALCDTAGMTNERWLECRAHGPKGTIPYTVGGSDVAAIFGVSPFKRLWQYIVTRSTRERTYVRYINGQKIKHTVSPVLGQCAAHNSEVVYTLDFQVTPHQLRHTYITNLLYSGADPKTVQYLAGHKNSKITMDTYAKVKYNRPEQLLPVVDRAFSSEKGSENTTQTLE